MTTIAARLLDGAVELAWDDQTTWGSERIISDAKVFTVPGVGVFGLSGAANSADIIEEALKVKRKKEWGDRQFMLLGVVPAMRTLLREHGVLTVGDGSVEKWECSGIVVVGETCGYLATDFCFLGTREKMWAVGSGSDYAKGAMAMGADVRKAVEVASLFDVNTGRGIETMTVKL